MRVSLLLFFALTFIGLQGCAASLPRNDGVGGADDRRIERVRYGIVENVRLLALQSAGGESEEEEEENTTEEKENTNTANEAVTEGSKTELLGEGIELIVRFQNSDEVITIIQEDNPYEIFEPGDVVRIMTVDGNTRVLQ